jgi:gliding motility-associated protein GldM
MAGVKETPRQKMIGLMYLVLTAMLALNVDSAVLERFIYIDQTLEQQVSENSKQNSQVVQGIAATVEEKGNRGPDLKVLETAKQVRERTNKTIQYTKQIKQGIIDYSGGFDEEGRLVGARDMDKIATYMIQQKRGDSLKVVLNDYVDFLNKTVGTSFSPIANDGKDDPYFKNIPNQRMKDFKSLLFESTPTAGGLASISQLMNKVLSYESVALERLADKVGAKDISFDRIIPMVLPESKLVAAGGKYKAQLFVSAASSGVTPTMRVNGKPIPVIDGMGQIEFPATGGNYDKSGRAVKKFTAEIDLGDTTYNSVIEYVVAKPVIQITSASVQALYRNCGNKLDVQVPALGASYNPTFKATGGSLISGKGGKVTAIPTGKEYKLSVYSNGQFIGTETFRVKPIPTPDLILKAGGKMVDEKRGVSKVPREVTLDAVPDPDFAQFLPDDARYMATAWEVTLARGSRPIETKRVSGRRANLQSFISKARKGDRIVIEIKEVQRKNFRGETEVIKINVGQRIKQFPIN